MELHDYIIQICEKAKDARFETARLTEEPPTSFPRMKRI